MGLRQKDWARRETARLRAVLGGKCAHCGTSLNLQFDCKEARGDRHHKIEWSHRISFYRREHAAGNLQLLCGTCNGAKGIEERYNAICAPLAAEFIQAAAEALEL